MSLYDVGVPQGFNFGTLLFSLYMLPLDALFRKHGTTLHFNADNCKKLSSGAHSVKRLIDCLFDIRCQELDVLKKLIEKKRFCCLHLMVPAGISFSSFGPFEKNKIY